MEEQKKQDGAERKSHNHSNRRRGYFIDPKKPAPDASAPQKSNPEVAQDKNNGGENANHHKKNRHNRNRHRHKTPNQVEDAVTNNSQAPSTSAPENTQKNADTKKPGENKNKNQNQLCKAGDAGSIRGRGTKIPHAAGQLSLCATTTEPTCHN